MTAGRKARLLTAAQCRGEAGKLNSRTALAW
jgi:hypothetical protein